MNSEFETNTILPFKTPQNILTQNTANFIINTKQFIKPKLFNNQQITKKKLPAQDICNSFLSTFNTLFNQTQFDPLLFSNRSKLFNFSIIILLFFISLLPLYIHH